MSSWRAKLTQEQLNDFCSANMSEPIPLSQADVSRPFVYERAHGLFYVPFSKHALAMSFLLALQHDCEDGIEVADKLKLEYSEGTAEHWLKHTPGAAFKSSMGKTVQIASARGLLVLERRLFAPCTEVFAN